MAMFRHTAFYTWEEFYDSKIAYEIHSTFIFFIYLPVTSNTNRGYHYIFSLTPKKIHQNKEKCKPQINIANLKDGANSYATGTQRWDSFRKDTHSAAFISYGKIEKRNTDWCEANLQEMEKKTC